MPRRSLTYESVEVVGGGNVAFRHLHPTQQPARRCPGNVDNFANASIAWQQTQKLQSGKRRVPRPVVRGGGSSPAVLFRRRRSRVSGSPSTSTSTWAARVRDPGQQARNHAPEARVQSSHGDAFCAARGGRSKRPSQGIKKRFATQPADSAAFRRSSFYKRWWRAVLVGQSARQQKNTP
eukprot:364690-Chlamydomonas_euryale.AAC.10